jgi:hypothetical protein
MGLGNPIDPPQETTGQIAMCTRKGGAPLRSPTNRCN